MIELNLDPVIVMRFILRYKKTLFFCGFLLISWSIFLTYERSHYNLVSNKELKVVRKKLAALSSQEKQDLAYFFTYANLFSQYPYTLIGYKPMSICNFLQQSDDLPPILRADYERPVHRAFADALNRGYQAWEKNQSLFPLKKYLIIRHHASNSKGMIEIALIHSDLCLTKIEEHLGDFCGILGKQYKSGDVFDILTHPDHENFYKVSQHNRLLGILLGFGRNNAYLFEHNRHDILQSFTNEWPYWPRKWRLPGFASDPSTEETKQLKEAYNKARKFIRWTYFNRNNLEVTLALLSRSK